MKISCTDCGIAKKQEDSKLICVKFKYLMTVGTAETERECGYFTTFIEEDGEILTPEEHLMLKEVEMQSRAFKGPI